MLKKYFFDTPFGTIISVADDNFLYVLQFAESFLLNDQIDQLEKKFDTVIVQGQTQITEKIEQELGAYCRGTLKKFTVPLFFNGTSFQKEVWGSCADIEYGKTTTYQGLAHVVKDSQASRAVGTALGKNCHIIIVPCHRIIRSGGALGGYAGGLEKKSRLLAHEQLFKNMH